MTKYQQALWAAAWVLVPGTFWAQPPEPLLINYGATWAGEGSMIILSESLNDDGIDCFALDSGIPVPTVIAEFKTEVRFVVRRFIKLEVHAPSQTLYFNSNRAFFVANEKSLEFFDDSVYFSYKPATGGFLRTPVNWTTNSMDVIEVNAHTGQEVLLHSIPLASFPTSMETNNIGPELLLAPNLIAVTATQVHQPIIGHDIVAVDISDPTPALAYIRDGGLPSPAPEGIDGDILRFRDGIGAFEMQWLDVISGDFVRTVNVGAPWVSHSVNEDTGDYYFHLDARVVEDPIDSGIFYTEIPVVVFEDDFTTHSEVAFRIAYPAEPPSPQDYLDHLLEKREPLAGSPFPARKRVSPVIFKDPDRNADARIDVADYIRRLNEVNAK